MLLLVFDVDHLVALRTFSDVATTVSFMEVDAVDGKTVEAVGTLLGLHFFHLVYFQLAFKYIFLSSKSILIDKNN